MTRLARTVATALALALAFLAPTLAPSPAHAATDTVRNLQVTYDVQSDGSLDVTYVLEWDFGEKGRRGIEFGIATRESWDQDRSKDAVYEISDIQVSSPSGAPATWQERESGYGSDGEIMLRIGDADQPLDTRTATYQISYTVHGAMRTFDGVPELYWDVTSHDYPDVEEFSVTVTGPEGVDRARCLVGSKECSQSVSDGVATLSGSDVERGDPLTVVAAFPTGSVANAEPILEDRRLSWPELASQDSTFTIDGDGITTVEHTLVYDLPEDSVEEEFSYRIPTRLPVTSTEDRVWRVTGLQATDGLGEPHELRSTVPVEGESQERLRVRVNARTTPPTATVVLTYQVEGAFETQGDVARFRLPVAVDTDNSEASATIVWEFPGEVLDAECVVMDSNGQEQQRDCHADDSVVVTGGTVTLDSPGSGSISIIREFAVDVPADSVGGATAILEPSRDRARRMAAIGITGSSIGGLALAVGSGFLLRRRAARARDQRYTDVAPGLTDPEGTVATVAAQPDVPVQFDAPELEPAVAGLLLDREFKGRHTAATLTRMAVNGAVRMTPFPLRLELGDPDAVETMLELELADNLDQHFEGGRSVQRHVWRLNRVINSHQLDVLRDRRYFQKGRSASSVRGLAILLLGVALPVVSTLLAVFLDNWVVRAGFIGLGVGSIIAAVVVASLNPVRALTAEGSALLDQVRGFRLYLETAEAHQLNYEADQDIFSRNLPWAVLFDLTERWTKLCRELAAAGHIPPLEATFGGDLSSMALVSNLNTLSSASNVARMENPATVSSGSSWSSSGGSGGSSGFSGGSFGGGGGGGTSAGSW